MLSEVKCATPTPTRDQQPQYPCTHGLSVRSKFLTYRRSSSGKLCTKYPVTGMAGTRDGYSPQLVIRVYAALKGVRVLGKIY